MVDQQLMLFVNDVDDETAENCILSNEINTGFNVLDKADVSAPQIIGILIELSE